MCARDVKNANGKRAKIVTASKLGTISAKPIPDPPGMKSLFLSSLCSVAVVRYAIQGEGCSPPLLAAQNFEKS